MVNRSEFAALSALLVFDLILMGFGGGGYWLLNWLSPIGILFILAGSAWVTVRHNARLLWTPLFWFRVTMAVYFGFGALIPQIGNPASQRFVRYLYNFNDGEEAKLNLLIVIGTLCVLIGAALAERVFRLRSSAPPKDGGFGETRGMLSVGVAFWMIGAAYKYIILLPSTLGLTQVTMPGAVGALIFFSYVGIFLVSAWVAANRASLFPVLLSLVLVEVGTGVLMLNKLEALFPPMMFGLGLLTRGITLRRVLLLLGALALSFSLLQPLVGYARIQQVLHKGALQNATSLAERASYIGSYFDLEGSAKDRTGVQLALVRLSFVNAGTFVVSQYDAGAPGDSLRYAFVAFVPRAVWKDKPLTTDVGVELAQLATGRVGLNSISPGWIAEAYWNYGWAGLPALLIPIGALFAILSWLSLRAIEQQDWASMPVLFIGLRMGTRVDGQIAPDVVGSLAILIGYMLLLPILRMIVQNRTSKVKSRAPVSQSTSNSVHLRVEGK